METTQEAPATPAKEPEVLSAIEAQELIDPLPEVNPAAITAEEDRQEAVATPPEPAANKPAVKPMEKPAKTSRSAPVDDKGRPHDPLIHETNDDGTPIFRADGKTLKRRRHPLKEWKRTSKVVLDDAPEPVAEQTTAGPPPMSPEEKEMQLTASAATLAGLQLMMMKAALGPKIGDEDAQKEELMNAWKRVFQHYGMGELHPLLGLGMVTGGIVVVGLQHEETLSRFQKISNWFQHAMLSLWQRLVGRRRMRTATEEEVEREDKAA